MFQTTCWGFVAVHRAWQEKGFPRLMFYCFHNHPPLLRLCCGEWRILRTAAATQKPKFCKDIVPETMLTGGTLPFGLSMVIEDWMNEKDEKGIVCVDNKYSISYITHSDLKPGQFNTHIFNQHRYNPTRFACYLINIPHIVQSVFV